MLNNVQKKKPYNWFLGKVCLSCICCLGLWLQVEGLKLPLKLEKVVFLLPYRTHVYRYDNFLFSNNVPVASLVVYLLLKKMSVTKAIARALG